MTVIRQRETARIYQFADHVRMAGQRSRKALPLASAPAQPLPGFVSGAGWYHDAAIREADPDRKG